MFLTNKLQMKHKMLLSNDDEMDKFTLALIKEIRKAQKGQETPEEACIS